MSIDEFQTMGIWLIRIVVYGVALAVGIGFVVVFVNSVRANLRSRGIVGIIIAALKLLILAGIIMIIVYGFKEYDLADKIQNMIP